MSVYPSPLVAGREFSGWVELNSGVDINRTDVRLVRLGSEESIAWSSPELSIGIEKMFERQRVTFKGTVPADQKWYEGIPGLSWRIDAEINTNRGRVGGNYYVDVVRG